MLFASLLSDAFRYSVFSQTGLHPSTPTHEAALTVLSRHESRHRLGKWLQISSTVSYVSVNTKQRIVRGSSQHSHPFFKKEKTATVFTFLPPLLGKKNTHKGDKREKLQCIPTNTPTHANDRLVPDEAKSCTVLSKCVWSQWNIQTDFGRTNSLSLKTSN